jgi:hypothetical protein
MYDGQHHSTGEADNATEAEQQAVDSPTSAFGGGEFHQQHARMAQ